MPRYRIFPSIGIARLGEDSDFFLGPEIPGHGPTEVATGAPVTRFKDSTRKKIRKQGARFHLFESNDGTVWVPASLLPTASVTWSVTLENKKSAVVRSDDPPTSPARPAIEPGSADMHIKGGTKTVAGADVVGPSFQGSFRTTGSGGAAFSAAVELGQLRTDSSGRLIVLGGNGKSDAPPNTPIGDSYFRNPKWYDDVSDGPVTAEVRLSPDAAPIQAEQGAWVIVGPPDYAPGIGGIVTLYDVIQHVGISELGLPAPSGQPSFDLDIAPLIQRARRLRWVHEDANWSHAGFNSPKLRSKAAADRQLRTEIRRRILKAEDLLEGHTSPAGPPYRLRDHQKRFLQDWVDGNFDDTPVSPAATPSAAGLTRAALEGAVGQGFCPGIEAGIIVLDKTIYAAPFDFRIDHASVAAGDMTALMAQPWQADFLKCHTEWWPSQRPDLAFQSADEDDFEKWVRGAGEHRLLVERSARLGFIVQQGANEVFLEMERDSSLPKNPGS